MITPRGSEIATIVKLLESEEYETAEDLAKEILKTAHSLFQERDWYIWINREATLTLLYGPFAQRREAEKCAERAGIGGENYTTKLLSPAAMDRRAEKYDAKRGAVLCSCGHDKGLHEHPKTAGRCMYGSFTNQKWYSECDCKRYEV